MYSSSGLSVSFSTGVAEAVTPEVVLLVLSAGSSPEHELMVRTNRSPTNGEMSLCHMVILLMDGFEISSDRRQKTCGLWCLVLAGRCCSISMTGVKTRSEEHTSELQSRLHLVCRLLLEKKK